MHVPLLEDQEYCYITYINWPWMMNDLKIYNKKINNVLLHQKDAIV